MQLNFNLRFKVGDKITVTRSELHDIGPLLGKEYLNTARHEGWRVSWVEKNPKGNPKTPFNTSKASGIAEACTRYETYKKATSIQEAVALGCKAKDLISDLNGGFLQLHKPPPPKGDTVTCSFTVKSIETPKHDLKLVVNSVGSEFQHSTQSPCTR